MKMWRIKFFIVISLLGISIGTYYLYHTYQSTEQILDFDDTRDTNDILDIFKRDWYWLIASDEYSPEFMLKYRSPTQDFSRIGQLQIKVLRLKNAFIGFIAYYMKTSNEGFILFLDVNPSFRGKGYSERLIQHALNDLKQRSASIVRLVTRTNNTHAINLYKRVNFIETSRNDGFIYFEKQL